MWRIAACHTHERYVVIGLMIHTFSAFSLKLRRTGNDVNLKDGYGQTPLSLAAKNGHEAVVRLLLRREEVDGTLLTDWR